MFRSMTKSFLSGFSVCLFVLLVHVNSSLHAQQIPAGTPLVINEFMASNNSEADPQGQFDDWIELHNYGTDVVDLSGLHLTDNLSVPDKWQIPPDTVIEPGGYLLIWADNDVHDTGLHADFKLSADGEAIALFDRDGTTPIDSVTFGGQTTDVSYGRYPDAADDWRFFSTPTPGQENADAYPGEVQALTYSHDSGLHDEPFHVTLATETEDATIYYSLSGQNPLELNGRGRPLGTVYTGPILVDRSVCLRAQAIKTDWKPTGLTSRSYTFLTPDVLAFSSNLPIIVVETYGQAIQYSANPSYKQSSVMVVKPDSVSGRAAIGGAMDFSGRAGFRVRGRSSSFLWPKMQYALEIWDSEDSDRSVSILGFPPESDWVLLGPYSDKTLMRTVLPYLWSNEIGRYAARTQFVEMFLDTDDRVVTQGDYLGVYVFMEKIKRDENRVDIEELAPGHDQEPEVTGGYLLRKDWAESPHFDTVTGMELEYREPKAHEITDPQKAYIKGYMDAFETVLYGSDFKDPTEGYAKYIDVDSFIDYHLMTEFPKNGDGYYHSTFMYKDRGAKLELGPIWDYNLSMGNFGSGSLSSAQGWYYPERAANGTHKWLIRLFEDLEFRLKTADRWFELREEVFSNAKLLTDIDRVALLLDEAQARNFDRWNVLGRQIDYNPPGAQNRDTYQKEVDWLKGWLEDRVAWMDQAIAEQRAARPPRFWVDGEEQNGNGVVQTDAALSLSSDRGRIYYTVDGSDPRVAGTAQTDSPIHVLVSEESSKNIFIPSGAIGDAWKGSQLFSERDWTHAKGIVGYDVGSGTNDLIDTDLGDRLYQKRTSCYVRIHFDNVAEDMSQFDLMTLNMRYDDGFVAYLNGEEVARANAPSSLAWDSAATAEAADDAAFTPEAFDLSSYLDILEPDRNILAIHGLNVSLDDSDFLIAAELVIEKLDSNDEYGIAPTAVEYAAPMTLTEAVTIKARTLNGSAWSALNRAIYAVGPVAENLHITRAVVPPVDRADEGFVELTNQGAEPINLNLVELTDGIDFVFPSIDLAPDEHVVVVQDRQAFEARYGTDLNIAGEFTGSLAPGERIRLEDAIGQVIQNVTVQDN